MPHSGAVRFAAKSLSEALQNGTSPWVQPIVVIWGEFAQHQHDEKGVTYLAASSLSEWLGQQPMKLSAARVEELVMAVELLRQAALVVSSRSGRLRSQKPSRIRRGEGC